METGRFFIQEMPLSVRSVRERVELFLYANGLRLDAMDRYIAVLDAEDRIVAGGGLDGDVVKGIAVADEVRSEGIANVLVSRLLSMASEAGFPQVKVFTKPENKDIFQSLGFHLIAEAPKAVLLENGRGLEAYLRYLAGFRKEDGATAGVIVMHADPFTLGHRFLVEEAAKQADRLFVIPVREDRSRFPYAERRSMVKAGCSAGVEVLEGSDYQISAATFPTYFLKDLSDAAETQMRLDLDLFGRHIAPALGVSVRFVGSEPADPLTARYNALMREILPERGIRVVEIPRLCDGTGPVSASRVRAALDAGRFPWRMTPAGTRPYLLAELMARSLRMELDAPFKPGLVDRGSRGAHTDMDYALMAGSIDVIRRSFPQHWAEGLDPVALGKAVEADVLAFTGGVNTHRGAIFSQVLTALSVLRMPEGADEACLSATMASISACVSPSESTHGGKAVLAFGVKGALQMAQEGYRELFSDWLPYYRTVRTEPYALQKTLLRIMSGLDDTCIIHRVGFERARTVRAEAAALLQAFSEEKLKEMDRRYCTGGISPGGSADMLALTLLVDSIFQQL